MKNILFISVDFFEYTLQIKNILLNKGYKVDFFDERPSNNIFTKGLIRLKSSFINFFINQYYKKIDKQIANNNYDILLVIKGECITRKFLLNFKINNPNAELIFYTWDSFTNNSNQFNILDLFDRSYTFDPDDSKKYNINFRPLFFLDNFKDLANKKKYSYRYDFLFIGSAHSDRYIICEKLIEFISVLGLKSYTYYYLQDKLVFYFKRLFDPTFMYFNVSKINFKNLSMNSILNLYKDANVILDIHHPSQNGLTIRTFETLGAKKKIITTNEQIKKYIFYNSNNILIIDRKSPKIDINFFKQNFQDCDKDLYYAMSLDGWIDSIFFNKFINKFWGPSF